MWCVAMLTRSRTTGKATVLRFPRSSQTCIAFDNWINTLSLFLLKISPRFLRSTYAGTFCLPRNISGITWWGDYKMGAPGVPFPYTSLMTLGVTFSCVLLTVLVPFLILDRGPLFLEHVFGFFYFYFLVFKSTVIPTFYYILFSVSVS